MISCILIELSVKAVVKKKKTVHRVRNVDLCFAFICYSQEKLRINVTLSFNLAILTTVIHLQPLRHPRMEENYRIAVSYCGT